MNTASKRPKHEAASGGEPAGGNTKPTQHKQPVPRLPHESDESADQQGGAERSSPEVARQAYKDVAEGRVDTDRGPVLEELSKRLSENQATADEKRPSKPGQ